MNFRGDLNGLRAIAVMAVLLFHFGVPGFSGGFTGVDVFFVLSGFLMTALIFGGMDAGRFSLRRFYLARAKRIVPALLVLCLTLLVFAWFFLTPNDYASLGKHVAASASFLSNFTYRSEINYFDASAHEKWLLHTWSLSVEWQFYLFYPLCLLGLRACCDLRRVRQIVPLLATSFLALAMVSGWQKPEASFYLLPARAWEMLAGGVVFLYPVPGRWRIRPWLEILGLCLLLLSIVFLTRGEVWPDWRTLLPVSGTMLVLLANRQDSPWTGNVFFQWVGKISYSAYLWHWPLVVAANYLGLTHDPRWIVFGIVASLGLAEVSYRWIETPFRHYSWPTGRALASLGAASAAVVLLGWGVLVSGGARYEFRPMGSGPRIDFLNAYQAMHQGLAASYRYECDFYDTASNVARTDIDAACYQGMGGGVLLWGDSHAQALSWGLRQQLPRHAEFYQVATSGCKPALTEEDSALACRNSNRFAMALIAQKKPSLVLIAQREGHEHRDWRALSEKLRALGAGQVVLVGPVPQWHPSLPEVIARRHWGHSLEGRVRDSSLDAAALKTDAYLAAALPGAVGFDYVSLIGALCDDDGCLVKPPGKEQLLLVDYGHLSNAGSEFVAREIIAKQVMKYLTAH